MQTPASEATAAALAILRDPSGLSWFVVSLAVLPVHMYVMAIHSGRWRNVAAGLALYAVHWAYEIGNALVQHFTGHALWTVPRGTAFLLLVGVCVEISLMFSSAGLLFSYLLPESPKKKIFGFNNRSVLAVLCAAGYALAEIPLSMSGIFVWVYPWWGAFPVFSTVYVPFFPGAVAVAAFHVHDFTPRNAALFIGALSFVDAAAFVYFGLVKHWI